MFEQLRERFSRWVVYRETVRQLSWLDDHILADSGMTRQQIKPRARHASRLRELQ